MTNLAIHVLMHSHGDERDGIPRFGWYRPTGIRIRLRDRAKGTSEYLETRSGGVAQRDLPDAQYEVSLDALPGFFCLTQLPGAGGPVRKPAAVPVIQVPAHGGEHELHIFPDDPNWLVPLRLTLASAAEEAAEEQATGLAGVKVKVTNTDGYSEDFTSLADGSVYATGPPGEVAVKPEELPSLVPVPSDFVMRTDQEQETVEIRYRRMRAHITVRPELHPFGAVHAIPGVTFELSRDGQEIPLREVSQGSQACVFSDLEPGQVTVQVIAPKKYNGSPIRLIGKIEEISVNLSAGETLDLSQYFRFEYLTGKARGRIRNSSGQGLEDISLIASSNGLVETATTDHDGKYTLDGLRAGQWTIMLDQSAVKSGGQTLIAQPGQQVVTIQSGKTAKANFKLISDEHGIRGQVRNSQGNPIPNAIVEIRNHRMKVIDVVVADAQGAYSWKSPSPGMFVVNLLTRDGRTVQRQTVTVNSWAVQDLIAADTPDGAETYELRRDRADRSPADGGGGPVVREAVTDLAAYPVLTEEVSTTGVPAPVAGGPAGGGYGAGYGQAVDQAIRDVLGWRPGGDVAGFQAALTGAFQLREVEGHTEWTWQQRGYSVQADMGALTGAQASIYARAKAALDQLLPLLAGLTSLNPALFPEQDREAIRTVVTTEITELVGELALEGGPRIQRVDELFGLLLGDNVGSTNLNPDIVQGQLGELRQRFALTPDWIETVDDERVVTNFRVIIEHILALQASWSSIDRDLLSVLDSRTSLGTVLIWLSRGLEAVCESVSDLTFALDSVYIDAAQRQVIELSFGSGQPPLLLSDLLDWIVRATRDEGPRLIQDAGRDGVRAFAPVLRRLRGLVGQTIQAVKDPGLPPGLQTPRVIRALQVLHDQLREATRLAGLVHLDQAPVITSATASIDECTGLTTFTLGGANFRNPASAVLLVEEQEDVPDVPSRYANADSATKATVIFRIPNRRVNWELVFINGDGTQNYPPFPIPTPIQR